MMEITDLWIQFGQHIHQDFLIEFPDFFSGIAFVLTNFSVEQKQELLLFLKELLSADLTPDQKLDIWLASEASFFVSTEQIDVFLRQLAEIVDKDLENAD